MKRRTKKQVFEFYRVFLHPEEEGIAIEPCTPLRQVSTKYLLEKTCARAYGGGDFVALEVGDSVDGFPLSYWVIKIKSAAKQDKKEVFLSDSEAEALRCVYSPAQLIANEPVSLGSLERKQFYQVSYPVLEGYSAFSWHRGVLAANVASELRTLSVLQPSPKRQGIKKPPKGRREGAEHVVVRAQHKKGKSYAFIENHLIEKFGSTPEWVNLDEQEKKIKATRIRENALRTAIYRAKREKKE